MVCAYSHAGRAYLFFPSSFSLPISAFYGLSLVDSTVEVPTPSQGHLRLLEFRCQSSVYGIHTSYSSHSLQGRRHTRCEVMLLLGILPKILLTRVHRLSNRGTQASCQFVEWLETANSTAGISADTCAKVRVFIQVRLRDTLRRLFSTATSQDSVGYVGLGISVAPASRTQVHAYGSPAGMIRSRAFLLRLR